ncbi:MAG: chromate efflux transporter [Actinomycetota bacterium]|nr:MAG: chromate efflux transporter [Actinomycetota bacterium]
MTGVPDATPPRATAPQERPGSAWEVLGVALKLGLTSFGGPNAHAGYFHAEYVVRRRWLSDELFAELLAISQALPGPSSSQLGAAIGFCRSRTRGAVAAWLGFTLPSAILMIGFAWFAYGRDLRGAVWLHALGLVAVAVVLDAVLSLGRRLASTWPTAAAAVGAAVAVLLIPSPVTQVAVLLVAAAIGAVFRRRTITAAMLSTLPAVTRRAGRLCLAAFVLGLVLLAALANTSPLANLAQAMYRSGTLVFGGGHVVLPLLQASTVPNLVSEQQFLTGYGAAQAIPGPLFTFSAFLGQSSTGPVGAIVAVVAIFAPGMLLLFGLLPYWTRIRTAPTVHAGLVMVNGAVVGLLAAAWYDPIIVSSVHAPLDVAFAAALFLFLRLRVPPWAVVVGAIAASPLLGW